jgi:transposase, IS5 family
VLLTNVHFPTDFNVLYDAIRKVISECHKLAMAFKLSGSRQWRYQQRSFRRKYRTIQKTSKTNTEDYESCVLDYLVAALDHIDDAKVVLNQLTSSEVSEVKLNNLRTYLKYAELLEDQIDRRVLKDEEIPHKDKIFSIFKPYTEWIVKGKPGITCELGVKLAIVEDENRFILYHRVMQNETDDKVAVALATEVKNRYPELHSMSFDKGFHSPQNQIDLRAILNKVVLPKKGKLDKEAYEREHDMEFKHLRKKHSAVESAINGLEYHGLDKCRDYGIERLYRYVSLSVLSRNIKRIGDIVREEELAREARQRGPYKKAA